MPDIPYYATNNAHMFYLVFPNLTKRSEFIKYMKEHEVLTVFHYLSLHTSPYYHEKHDGRELPNCDRYADCLVRLPMYFELEIEQVKDITKLIKEFIASK